VANELPSDHLHKSKAVSPWAPDAEGVSVRLLSPFVDYPIGDFRHKDASIIVRPDLIVVATKFIRVARPEDYYSEVEFLTPFEIRVLSSVLLSCHGTHIQECAGCIWSPGQNCVSWIPIWTCRVNGIWRR
jgi:hypothetical protein